MDRYASDICCRDRPAVQWVCEQVTIALRSSLLAPHPSYKCSPTAAASLLLAAASLFLLQRTILPGPEEYNSTNSAVLARAPDICDFSLHLSTYLSPSKLDA
jgi:hypothetical protein